LKKIIISVVSCLLLFTSDMAIAGDVERPCEVKDLVGAWELITAKYAGVVPDAYHDLLQPYQVRVYKKDHSFQQVASNKKLSNDQLTNLLSISQEETYKVENGLISTLDNQGKILERYSCSYFVEDAPKIKITKGTLSLLWTRQGKPLILNTYKKVTGND
jgi:hypothetical protein